VRAGIEREQFMDVIRKRQLELYAVMSAHQADGEGRKYDRAFLLSEGKRNLVMDLWEVQKYGLDSFSDPEYVCIYGDGPRRNGIAGVFAFSPGRQSRLSATS